MLDPSSRPSMSSSIAQQSPSTDLARKPLNLSKWQKTSTFRRGQATDIVLGDRAHFNPSLQFTSTMRSDYHGKHSDRPTAIRRETPSRPDLYVPTVPAGKPLGINVADRKEMHFSFGDTSEMNENRFESVTDASYKCPNAMKQNGEDVPPDMKNLTPAQQFHHKPSTAISAARIGLETRRDFPIDDRRFRSYITTTGDAYTQKMLPEDAIARKGQARGYVTNNQTSDIPLGDPSKEINYDTMARRTYVDHGDAYRQKQAEKSMRPKTDFLAMDRANVAEIEAYATTTAQTYRKPPIPPIRQELPANGVSAPNNIRSKSSIAFGESSSAHRETGTSVSRRDYTHNPETALATRMAIRSSVEDRILSKPGIQAAIQPNPIQPFTNSTTAATYRLSNLEDSMPAAGITLSHPSIGTSSIPSGDPAHYNFSKSSTTTSTAYHAHPTHKMIPHPILGANITRSTLTFPSADTDVPHPADRYTTTSHQAYIPHGVPPPPHVHAPAHPANPIANAELYPMSANQTTTQSHFQPLGPADHPGRYTAPHPLSTVKRLLFPSTSHIPTEQRFETTMEREFAQRRGLWDAEKAKSVGAKGSSVVFGDPRMRYFGDGMVWRESEGIVAV